jgi:hypothetical protein
MGNRSRTHTPVDLENQAYIGKSMEIVAWLIGAQISHSITHLHVRLLPISGTEMIEHDVLRLHKVGLIEPHMRGLIPLSLY